MPLTRLSAKDGTWDGLKQAWRAECEALGEDFDNYALGTFAILDPLALEHSKKAAEPDPAVRSRIAICADRGAIGS
jgi:hypothetical protein